MSARKKLDEIKETWGLETDNELSEKLKTSKANVDSWVKRNKIPEKWILKIGQMHQNELLEDIEKVDRALNNTNMISINFYEDISVSAGYGSSNEEKVPIKMEFDKNFLEKILNIRKFDNLDIIRVTGDSMLPYIKDGELIIIERINDAKSGDTVIANIDGELYIKRLKKTPFEKWLTLESENNEYPSIKLDTQEKLEAFTIIGIMRSKIKLY